MCFRVWVFGTSAYILCCSVWSVFGDDLYVDGHPQAPAASFSAPLWLFGFVSGLVAHPNAPSWQTSVCPFVWFDLYPGRTTVSRPQLTLVRLFPSVFRLASVRLFLCFDLTLHIGRLPRSPSQAHFTAPIFEALAWSIYSTYTQPFAGLLQCVPPLVWLGFAFPLGHTPKRPSPATSVCLCLFCWFSSVFFRVLWINLAPLGPSLLTPNPGLTVSPFFDLFLALHYIFS